MKNDAFTQEVVEAANKTDIIRLRSLVASVIRFDPAFNEAECDACMEYLRNRGIDITEAFRRNINERDVPADPSEWSMELFQDKVEDLRQNFAYNERIGEIKKIGQTVSADKIKQNDIPSFKEAPTGRRSRMNKPSPLMISGAIAAVVAVIVALVLLLRE